VALAVVVMAVMQTTNPAHLAQPTLVAVVVALPALAMAALAVLVW
jgi:hypothetical protein